MILPIFKEFTAILKPLPLSDNMFSTGTFVSLKKTCLVDDECIPNFFSSSPNVIPLLDSFGTIKPVMFLSSSILAKTINNFANPAFDIHIF